MAEFNTFALSGPVSDSDHVLVVRPGTDDTPLQGEMQRLSDYFAARGDGFLLGTLAKWEAAKARSTGNPARCLFIGDSNVVGQGDNSGTTIFTKGFARYFADAMGWRTGSVWGNGNVGNAATYHGYNSTVAFTGANWLLNSSDGVMGGQMFRNARTAAGTLTWTPAEAFDTLKIAYPVFTGNDPSVAIKVDGVTLETVSQSASSNLVRKTYTGLSLTTHTVEIVMSGTGSSGDGFLISMEIQDRTNRTPVYNQAGWGSAKAADFDTQTNPWSSLNHMSAEQFDFAFVYCTINDLIAGTADETYYATLQEVVNTLSATADGCLMFGYPNNNANVLGGKGVTMTKTLRNIAQDYGWSFLDSRDVLTHSNALANVRGYRYDDAHPNHTGHQALADYMSARIGPYL